MLYVILNFLFFLLFAHRKWVNTHINKIDMCVALLCNCEKGILWKFVVVIYDFLSVCRSEIELHGNKCTCYERLNFNDVSYPTFLSLSRFCSLTRFHLILVARNRVEILFRWWCEKHNNSIIYAFFLTNLTWYLLSLFLFLSFIG
jgi:hypothetical protein